VSDIDWAPLRSIIQDNQSFLITSHVRPDADALGSERGVAAILSAMGKDAAIINATAPPSNLLFINEDGAVRKLGEDISRSSLPEFDVHVIVDTSAWKQIGDMADIIRPSKKTRVVIDHHVSSDDMHATEFKDVTSAATGQLVFEAAQYLGVDIDSNTASWLYAAIATDTGWFRFPSTSAETMRVAADLIEAGAQPDVLYNFVHEQRSLAKVQLAGRILSRTQLVCNGRLAWIYADTDDFKATGAVPADTEGLVNQCLTIAGSVAAFIAVELPTSQVKFSLRCRPPFDVAELASEFGGGGHKLASGATIQGDLKPALDQVIAAYSRMLDTDT